MSVYNVRAGDTLSHIALRTDTSVNRLAKVNDIANVNEISADQKLVIPGQRDDFAGAGAPVQGPSLTGGPQAVAPTGEADQVGGTSSSTQAALEQARGLIGRAYGDPAGASGEAVGPDSPFMHCAQFVNAVYPDLPPRAPELASMAQPGVDPKPGDVVTSAQPAPWGHVGIMTEQGTVIHSIPGRGVHESSMAAFEASSPITGVIPR
ncbi:MAG TPA: LysM peptidoglycan-binding domain-containing protein [Myxococcaceae bacterium]|nr:LysM peptidoglycan-binding domain-containing protein [Myxococcaceae bacterium]